MKFLKLLDDKLEEIFLVIVMVAATAIVALQVITRYILKTSLPWSEEIARYLFLWLTWVGASYATKERKHVCIDIVITRMPPQVQGICNVIVDIIWFLFLVMMARLSLRLTMSVASGGQMATGSHLPMWVPYASIPTGMTLMTIRLLQNCYKDFKAYKSGRKEGENA